MSPSPYTAAQEKRSNVILAAGVVACTGLLTVLATSALGSGVGSPSFIASTKLPAATAVMAAPGGVAQAGTATRDGASVHPASWTIAPTSKIQGQARADSPTAVNAVPAVVTGGPALHLTVAKSAQVTAARQLQRKAAHVRTMHVQRPHTQVGTPAAATLPVVTPALATRTSSPSGDSSSAGALTSTAHAVPSTTDTSRGSNSSDTTSGSTGSSAVPLATQPAGITAATFKGILPASLGGYNVFAQSDTAFAQQLVVEANATILQDLTNGTNGFGAGGYVFPAGAPFGTSNPLFTGQSYGPTWYPSSAAPEPTPSHWAIDPITGLPMDPAAGGDVTPSMWATSSWNPNSPGYDPGLYTAAGETPPA